MMEIRTKESYSFSIISEIIRIAVNIPSFLSSEDDTDPNWHISFITIIEKSLLHSHSAIILPKTLPTSQAFEYLKSLLHSGYNYRPSRTLLFWF